MNMGVAVVTGGASGIGKAIVQAFCAKGFDVAIVYNRSEEAANALASELCAKGSKAVAVRADVSNSAEVNNAVSEIERILGVPSVLVNNAGIAEQKLFTDITDDDWQKMLGVNLTGAFNMCRRVLPEMIKRKYGRIINISSMWGQVGASCEVHYSASKAGLIGLTKALAQEEAPSGITVNCVAPGAVDTKMMASFSEDDVNSLCEEIPVGRLGTPSEIASAVMFLASENASYITGQVIAVNGGFVL